MTTASNIDKYALYSIGGLYFVFHLTYIVYFLARYSRYSKIGKEQSNEGFFDEKLDKNNNNNNENGYNTLNNDERPISINTINVRPGTKSSTFSDKQSEVIKPSGEIKYRNLQESPTSMPLTAPIQEARQATVNNPFNSSLNKSKAPTIGQK